RCSRRWPTRSTQPTPGPSPPLPRRSPAGRCAGGCALEPSSTPRTPPPWLGCSPWPAARPSAPTSAVAGRCGAGPGGCASSPRPPDGRAVPPGRGRGCRACTAADASPRAVFESPERGEGGVAGGVRQPRVAELGAEITRDYEGRAPLLIGALTGAMMFMTDLARSIALPVEIDFMAVSSYGNATRTSGVVRIVKDLDLDLTGRDRKSTRLNSSHVKISYAVFC